MDILSSEQFAAITHDTQAKVLSDSAQGPRVLLTPNDDIIKIFYPSKKWFRRHLFPHALRFNYSARRLNEAGLFAPKIKALFYCPQQKTHLITYPQIPGKDFREMTSIANPEPLAKLPAFLATLHQKGVFYHGIHLGNIILSLHQSIALVDIVSVKVHGAPLTLRQRAKNLAHLIYYRRDYKVFCAYNQRRFLQEYAESAALTPLQTHKLRDLIARRMKKKRYLLTKRY